MKITIALCLVAFAATVYSETCRRDGDCRETACITGHGYFLHCRGGICLCTHDTFVGKNCTDGDPQTCLALHDNRCQEHGRVWRCFDNICHCAKP